MTRERAEAELGRRAVATGKVTHAPRGHAPPPALASGLLKRS
jgi:hypothetical protein